MSRLTVQFRELFHLALSGVPVWLARRESYVGLRRWLSATPKRFERPGPIAAWQRGKDWRHRKIVFPETELIIDGFPGSGNSFVASSLRDALGEETDIVSHFHHTVQLERAVAFGVPAVVVVREPLAAATSLKSKEPNVWDWVILWRWIVYHRCVARHLDRLDVFLFDEVVENVDVIRRKSRAVAELAALRGVDEMAPNTSYTRPSERRVEIDESSWANSLFLRSARRLYDRIRENLPS